MTSTNDPATQALLDRLIRYDRQAWNELVATYSGLLFAVVRRTFSRYGFQASNADVEDMVADVWNNLLANDLRIMRQCRRRGFFLQTLYVLARNRSIDLMRRRKMETAPLDGNETATERPEFSLPPAALDVSASILRQALATLMPKERTLIGLFFLQDKSYKEMAALTGISINSIGPILSRALIKLRNVLQT